MKSPRKGPPILKCPVHRRGSHGGDVLPGGFCAFGRCSSSRQLAGQRWAGARGKNGWMTKHHKKPWDFEWEKRRVIDSMGQMRFWPSKLRPCVLLDYGAFLWMQCAIYACIRYILRQSHWHCRWYSLFLENAESPAKCHDFQVAGWWRISWRQSNYIIWYPIDVSPSRLWRWSLSPDCLHDAGKSARSSLMIFMGFFQGFH